jgi:hypothetical protein
MSNGRGESRAFFCWERVGKGEGAVERSEDAVPVY